MLLLLVLGGIAAIVGYVWILVMAFGESLLWGIVILLISPLALVFGVLHWEDAKVPTILLLIGSVVHFIGRVL